MNIALDDTTSGWPWTRTATANRNEKQNRQAKSPCEACDGEKKVPQAGGGGAWEGIPERRIRREYTKFIVEVKQVR
jgi:hypothetical protein